MSDNPCFGIYRARVAVSRDPETRKRVRLFIPQIFGVEMTGWALPISPGSVPATDTLVWAMFSGGEVDKPVYFPTAP